MKVFFTPDFTGGNPYQRELVAALEDEGDSVTLPHDLGGLIRGVAAHGPPDVVHFHWLDPLLLGDTRFGTFRSLTVLKGAWLIVQVVALRLLGATVVFTVHNLLEHDRQNPGVERAFKHVFVRLCDEVIYHCPSSVEAAVNTFHLRDDHDEKATVIPHGHYVNSYPNDLSRERARTKLSLDDDQFVYLYLGLIREYKNVPTLMETFAERFSDSDRLLVVGNPESEALERQIESIGRTDDRIRTEQRFVPDGELQVYLNAADVVVLPFRDILMSGSVILAMSFGKPVVAPEIGCLDWYLSDANGELTYDPDEQDGLAAAMDRARTVDLDTIGRRNFERIRELDWNRIARSTRAVYGRR